MTTSLPIRILPSLALAGALLFAGCLGDSHVIGEDDGGGLTSDGGPGGGEPCGPVTCGAGLVCCNASCGICTEPDGACITIACGDAGVLDGGPGCVDCAAPPPGCHYEGGSCTGCGVLVCDGACGGWGGGACGPSHYCDYGGGCGFDDGSGTCKPRPEACTADCPGVCGCDGLTYCNACMAAASGVDVQHTGACETPEPCDAQRAWGEGLCDAFFGYAWDGRACTGISGCSCVGADCSSTFDSIEACESAYAHCGGGSTCGTIAGLACGSHEWCDYDSCVVADAGGVCRPRPAACTEEYAPVCGCDGVTYSNACHAQAAGMDTAYSGECAEPPGDCRSTGCSSGYHCDACLTAGGGVAWVCLPEGAVC